MFKVYDKNTTTSIVVAACLLLYLPRVFIVTRFLFCQDHPFLIHFNLFQANILFLYPLKTSEKLSFFDVFREYKTGNQPGVGR